MAGKRHQRMEETRVHALREAVKLFLTQGYNNTTVSQIADSHWYTCYYSQPHPHTGGTATCDRQATCQLCGFYYGDYDPNVHSKGAHQPIDANPHKILCDCGATYIVSEPHSM